MTKLSIHTFLSLWLIILISCFAACRNEEAKGETAMPPAEYPVLTITKRQTTIFNDYPASIQGEQNIEIRPKIDGYIESIYVDEGSSVKAGQLLFRINAPQYEQAVRSAQADINIAQASVNSAKMQVEKVRPLVEKDIISRFELESAEYNLQSRQAALAQARANLANAKTNLGYTVVTSPVNGVVGMIPFKLGSLVSSNTIEPLTTVSNIGKIFAYFSVNEKERLAFRRNTKGNTTQERLATLPPVTLILADGSEYEQKGKIETESGFINYETGAATLRATFPNPGRHIQSGSSGRVRIPQTFDSVLLIPQQSTYELQGKRFVYLVQPGGTVKATQVDVLEGTSDGQFFVVEKGLAAGDKIVMDGINGLKDGMQVKPAPANADSVYQVMK
ncbi:MAG TPA: efflux RND transporter periplasmic adaptor subunit [Flavitalea sp.]|nr:efflux RND transporter periplasmic adaptor subunit [Flavitalea sp.]